MDRGFIFLCVWVFLGVLCLAFVIYNEIKRDRKYKLGQRLLDKYCKRDIIYNVTPRDNDGNLIYGKSYSVQFNRLVCDLNCKLYVESYVIVSGHISEIRTTIKEVWKLFNDGKSDVRIASDMNDSGKQCLT